MHLRCMTEYVNLSPYLITFGDGLRLHHASTMHDRVRSEKPSITCRAGYYAVHLLRKYTTMLGFFPHYSILRRRQTYDRKKELHNL